MTRDELIALLLKRRNNDVRIHIPREGDRGAYVLDIDGVTYESGDFERGDFIAIDTEVLIEEAPE